MQQPQGRLLWSAGSWPPTGARTAAPCTWSGITAPWTGIQGRMCWTLRTTPRACTRWGWACVEELLHVRVCTVAVRGVRKQQAAQVSCLAVSCLAAFTLHAARHQV